MRGKLLKAGWVLINPEAVDSETDFEFWLNVALEAVKVTTLYKKRSW